MSLDLFNAAEAREQVETATTELTQDQRKIDAQIAADAKLAPADLKAKHDAALEAAQGKESELMKEKGTVKAPEKKPDDVDLKHVKEEIRASLEDGWFGVDESRAIKALLSVPEHQMDELMEMYGGQDAFEKMMRDANAFNADEMALITGKLDADVNPGRYARAIEDCLTDSSWIPFYDDAQPQYVASALKSMTDKELKATVDTIGTDKIIAATKDSMEYNPQERLEVMAQVARVDPKARGAILDEALAGMSPPNSVKVARALGVMKEIGMDKMLATASERGIDLQDKLLKFAQVSASNSLKKDIWTMAYGEKLANMYSVANAAFTLKGADGFVAAYSALNDADKQEFLKNFGKVLPKHGATVEQAINKNFGSWTKEQWSTLAHAIHPDAPMFSPEYVKTVSGDEFEEIRDELTRRSWETLGDDKLVESTPKESKDVKAEVETETEAEIVSAQEDKAAAPSAPETTVEVETEQDGPILFDPNSPHGAEKAVELAKIGQDHKIIFSRIKDPVLRGLVEDFAIAYDSRSQEDMAAFHDKLYQLDPETLTAYSEKVDSWTPKGTQRSYQQGFKQTFASDIMLASQRNIVIDGQRDLSKVA